MQLTSRQTQILKAIIEEYINTAEPVASETIEKKYALGVSPATIRNEMVFLTLQGLLKQPHTSAGRVPTPIALRFYVENIMQEKKLSVTDEVSTKEKIWDLRNNQDRFFHQATLALSEKTGNLSIIALDSGDVYYSGVANILETPEFYDIDVTRTVLSLLDRQEAIQQLFFGQKFPDEQPVHVIFGADLGWSFFEPVGMAFANFTTGTKKGSVAVIGPCRLNFPYIFPTLRYFSGLISQIGVNW